MAGLVPSTDSVSASSERRPSPDDTVALAPDRPKALSADSTPVRTQAQLQAAKRKQMKIMERKKKFEEEKKLNGVYCVLTSRTHIDEKSSEDCKLPLDTKTFVVDHLGAVLGSKPDKTSKVKSLPFSGSGLSPNHFAVNFSDREFYVSDLSSGNTVLMRSLDQIPTSSGYLLEKGQHLLVGRLSLEVVEVIDSRSSFTTDYHVSFKVFRDEVDDGKFFTVKAFRGESITREMGASISDSDYELSVSLAEASIHYSSEFDSSVSEHSSSIAYITEKDMDNFVVFLNGRFYLKDSSDTKSRFFVQVIDIETGSKKSRVPSIPLATGDIIRAGGVDFDVEILRRCDSSSAVPSLFKDIGLFEYGNWSKRESMEDRNIVLERVCEHLPLSLFAIIDGHEGSLVADLFSCVLPYFINKSVQSWKKENLETSAVKEVFFNSFQKSVKVIESLGETSLYSGASVVASLIFIDSMTEKKVAITANVGDSRAYVIGKDLEKMLSELHRAANPEEKRRIEALGVAIVNGRVKGLEVTRAVGDFAMKSSGIIAEPSMSEHIFSEKDEYVVLASDGVWDSVTPTEIFQFCIERSNCEESCKESVHLAYKRGCGDNITVALVRI